VVHLPDTVKPDFDQAFPEHALKTSVRVVGVLRIEYKLAVIPRHFKGAAYRRLGLENVDGNKITKEALDHLPSNIAESFNFRYFAVYEKIVIPTHFFQADGMEDYGADGSRDPQIGIDGDAAHELA
jgi:hypothetical protein